MKEVIEIEDPKEEVKATQPNAVKGNLEESIKKN
jgi:hypothetical protein